MSTNVKLCVSDSPWDSNPVVSNSVSASVSSPVRSISPEPVRLEPFCPPAAVAKSSFCVGSTPCSICSMIEAISLSKLRSRLPSSPTNWASIPAGTSAFAVAPWPKTTITSPGPGTSPGNSSLTSPFMSITTVVLASINGAKLFAFISRFPL